MPGVPTTAAATLKTATQSIRVKTKSPRTSPGRAACQVFSSRVRASVVQPMVLRTLGDGRRHSAATRSTTAAGPCLALRRARSSSLSGVPSTSTQSVAQTLQSQPRARYNLWRAGPATLQTWAARAPPTPPARGSPKADPPVLIPPPPHPALDPAPSPHTRDHDETIRHRLVGA